MSHIIDSIVGFIWSPVLVVLCLATGLFFTFGLRFVQLRRLKTMVRMLFSKGDDEKKGVSSFQAFSLALSGRVGTGNIVGVATAIAMGVRRGLFSNEAGQGSGAIVSASASVSHQVKQGLVQAFSVYIDTLMVCTATAVMILACRTYNVIDPQGNIIYASPVVNLGEPDVSYTTSAIATLLGSNAAGITVSIALFFFAFTTAMAYYYNSETNISYLFGKSKYEHLAIKIFRIIITIMLFGGTVIEASTIWKLVDIGIGMMAWINIIAILLLSSIAFRTLHSYEKQEKEGKEPVFDPDELSIKNAEYWKKDSNKPAEVSEK